MSALKILITDDHSMIRKGMKLYLQLNLGVMSVQETDSCNTLLMALKKDHFTHLVADLILSDGNTLEVIPTIRNLYPDLKIMIFSMQPAEIYGKALKQYGVNYYLSKTAGEEEIIKQLNNFIHNQASTETENNFPDHTRNPFSQLSPRELEILHYLLKGMGTKEIADSLNIKMNTVSTLKSRVLEKTSCNNFKELLELATLHNVNY
jgi:DNA-binding NarL/FixJ family response regulator